MCALNWVAWVVRNLMYREEGGVYVYIWMAHTQFSVYADGVIFSVL